MGSLTANTPKPMLPLNGRPMIDHAIEHLHAAGIENIFANTHYLWSEMEPHLISNGVIPLREWPDILETGGGLKHALPHIGKEPIITMNSDAVWTGVNPVKALLAHWRNDMHALLLVTPLSTAATERVKGDFSLDGDVLTRDGDYLYTGAQIIRTQWLTDIDEKAFSLNKYWDYLAELGPVHAVVHDGSWCDVGHPAGLKTAESMLLNV